MPVGEFSGYTGDTLIHLADGTRKYMRDLEPGDELRLHDSSTIKVAEIFTFEFDGFISLVAPGLTITQYTTYYDPTTHSITTPQSQHKPTIYYRGILYNYYLYTTEIGSPIIAGSNSSTPFGILDIGMNDDNFLFDKHDNYRTHGPKFVLPHIWQDPPGIITDRYNNPIPSDIDYFI